VTDEALATLEPSQAPSPEDRVNPLQRLVLADRTARWTSRFTLLAVWQIAGTALERIPTPKGTWDFIYTEWGTSYPNATSDWTWYGNQLTSNLIESMRRAGIALSAVLVVGIILGYAMGRWWRVQAFFTDLVIVGIALPAFIWALLAVMWFGLLGFRAPVFVCFVSATPMLTVNVLQGALAVPRELRDMSDAYEVPFGTQARHLVLPSMAGYVMAGFRVAILAGWGAVTLVEWFGNMQGAGHRAHYWYDAANFEGLMGWGMIILVVVITIDRGILERVIRRAHQWRAGIVGLGAGDRTG
jgi:ABC-type nitrate/sulfonate/bicarbonate transport system permease component